jgi:hypothetical protein
MATKFVTNLDLVQNQILKGRFESVSSDPTTGTFTGWVIYNSTEKTLKYYDGTAWQRLVVSISSAGAASEAITVTNNSDGTVTITPNLATGTDDGVMSASDKAKLDASSAADSINTLVIRDANGRFQVATPVSGLDAANKSYVDSARTGLDVKASVKVATTGPITLSTGLEAGDEIDGYTLVAGDRVLVKNQDTASENGIYVVAESGAPSRADDADSSAEVTPGLFTFVEQGTTNADSGWVLITNAPITLGTTGLEFSLFSVAGNILAGAGLSKTGDVLDVNVDSNAASPTLEISSDRLRIASTAAGSGLSGGGGSPLAVNVASDGGIQITSDNLEIKVNSAVNGLDTTADGLALQSNMAGTGLTFTSGVLSVNAIDLDSSSGGGVTGILPIANGGTNASTEAQARTNLAATSPTGANTSTPVLARVANKVIGDGASTSFTVTHNFGTRAVVVQVFDSSSYDTVIADVVRTTTDSVTVSFSVAPASNAFTVVVTG